MALTAEDHSFVVCAYKENPYLEETVKSLLNQTVRSSVSISTSTPNAFIGEICMKYDLDLHVHDESRGAASDWNFAFGTAKTPLVTIAHQDDLYESLFTERVLASASSYSLQEVQFFYTDYYEMRNERRVDNNLLLAIKRVMNSRFRKFGINGRISSKRHLLTWGNPICCPAVTYVRQTVGEDPFDERFVNSCDYQTFVNMADRPGRFVYLPEVLMGHRIYEGSATSKNIEDDTRRREDLEILSSLWPRPMAHLINQVYALSEKSNS